jgi:response regulator RpfG family c-di-GMP phosphodiesterase
MKLGRLTAEERTLMETHPLIGDDLLRPLDLLVDVREVVRYHHERWDGSGYPDGLAGESIPLAARIVAIADAVEAMSGNRPYRTPLAAAAIVTELRTGRAAQWDPALVDVVLGLIDDGQLMFTPAGLELAVRAEQPERDRLVTVLLVEDNPDHALLVREAVEETLDHVVVTHAGDVASALDLLRGATWSLAVLDQHLPDGNGLELMRTLRTLSPTLPVVMMTGEGSEKFAIEAFRDGASDYVVKTNGFGQELAGRLRTLLAA